MQHTPSNVAPTRSGILAGKFCFAFLLFAPMCFIGETFAANTHASDKAVIAVNIARLAAAANRDLTAWAHFVDEDCIFSDDNGSLVSKAEMLAHYTKLPPQYDRAVDPREYRVHVYGSTAVLNYIATVHEQFGEADIVSEQRRTETLVRRNGVWILVAIQWDNIPVNHRRLSPGVDKKEYEQFVGRYQWRSGDAIDRVYLKEGELWSDFAGEIGKLLPGENGTFFFADDLGQETFTRDAAGRVDGYVYRRSDGQEIQAKRLE